MYDPEFGHIDEKNKTPPRRRRWLLIPFTIIATWIVLASFRSPRQWTCAACRLDRTDRAFIGIVWSGFEESACSRWYAANVELNHQHVWASKCSYDWVGPITVGGLIDSPVASLEKDFQLRVYQRFHKPLDAKDLFVKLGRWNGDVDNLSIDLSDWMNSGSQESWAEWWPKNRRG